MTAHNSPPPNTPSSISSGADDFDRNPCPPIGSSAVHPTSPARNPDVARMCVVCLDNPRTHALLPCGHRVLCAMCALQYEEFAAQQRARHTTVEGGCGNDVSVYPLSSHRTQRVGKGMPAAEMYAKATTARQPGGKCPSQHANACNACSNAGGVDFPPHNYTDTVHTCPLCRREVTGVLHVWDS